MDFRYEGEGSNIKPEFLPIFEHLETEFGKEYEIWVRCEDFGRWIGAGILNRSTKIAVTICLERGMRKIRDSITDPEIRKIRDHLTSKATDDLAL